MRKRLLIAFAIIILGFTAQGVYAATVTAVPTVTTGEKLIDEINTLREKVASKVAQLNLVEKRGILLTATEVSANKISGNDLKNTIRIVDVDELTKFSSVSAKSSFGISDISKGTRLSVIGLYNKQSKRILARFIETYTYPVFISGAITEIDKANFVITVASENKKNTFVDIENITKTSNYSSEDGLSKLGFSKLNVGDRVHVAGYENIKDKNRLSATRVIVFSDSPKNPNINAPQASSDSFEKPTATPSGKVTPKE